MKLALALLLVAACGDDKPAPQAPVHNQQAPAPQAEQPTGHSEVDEQLRRAQLEADEARKAARDAEEKLDRIQHDFADLDRRLTAAVDQVVAAQNDADRAAAKAKLQALQREKQDMEARIQAARAAAAKAQRNKGVKIDPKCVDNPLAKGCE